ncbi:MAG TPA: adenosylcobinamide-GDP ribazoletransferase [Chloroflexota bacterium]|nr:adenosylcobinamide-GDP ribazoletransferase [Chloroflexota bacterium]
MRAFFAPPILALQLLTAVPVPVSVPAEAAQLGWSLAFFPAVGALLGLALAGLDRVLLGLLPPAVAAALLLAAGALLTGALHLDGLMDTCDGVFGGRTRERRLEIMRDSRVGSFGALAGALQLLVKYAALVSLPVGMRGAALVLSLTLGRWAMAGATWGFPPARPDGLGAAFRAGASAPPVVVATASAAAVAWLAAGGAGLALLGGAAALALAGAAFLSRRLGGLTGDCYGALNEVVESGTLVALVALSATAA